MPVLALTMSRAWLAPSCASFFCSSKQSKTTFTTGALLLPGIGLLVDSVTAHAYADSASHAASRTRLSASCVTGVSQRITVSRLIV